MFKPSPESITQQTLNRFYGEIASMKLPNKELNKISLTVEQLMKEEEFIVYDSMRRYGLSLSRNRWSIDSEGRHLVAIRTGFGNIFLFEPAVGVVALYAPTAIKQLVKDPWRLTVEELEAILSTPNGARTFVAQVKKKLTQ